MTDWLFDTPWWLPVLIAGIGVVVFVSGNKRLDSKVRMAGLAVIALAVLLVAVSYFVDTPRERAVNQTRELCYAFERADWPTMSRILDPSATVTVLSAPIYANRDELIAAAKTAHEKYGFRSVRVLNTNSEQVQSQITVTLTLLTEQNTAIANTLTSQWQFEWQESRDGWTLVEVRALKIGNAQDAQMRPMFPAGK
jgi:hypothetical protein